MLGLTYTDAYSCHTLFIPGPVEGVWQRLPGLSSLHSSGNDSSLWPWSDLLGPDGVLLDT